MPHTFTQIHIQVVFAVKYRASLIQDFWRDELHKYITGVFQGNKHKMLQINSMPDHLHFFGGFRPNQSVSSIVQAVKAESSTWINKRGFCRSRFEWQEGFGAFSYSKDRIDSVVKYIQNQKEHHKKETFLEEYKRLLEEFEIEYDEKYLFTLPI